MVQPANLIGRRVREARLSRRPRLTQINLAALLQLEGLNIDQAQVSKIENLSRPVNDFEIAAFAKALHVSASWLLGETDKPERLP
jgi:transcriptional regulator with XRE-family HTH domain